MQIHLQRIVGAYVGSAHGAGQFYSRAVSEARDATAKAANDARDEDLDGQVGLTGTAQRKCEFAADMGLQAHALLMAAVGRSRRLRTGCRRALEALRAPDRTGRIDARP
jgi:hypothetical protein